MVINHKNNYELSHDHYHKSKYGNSQRSELKHFNNENREAGKDYVIDYPIFL